MVDADRDVVVLVDGDDNAIGTMDKLRAHGQRGTLHRAVSVCLFDDRGRVLLQRRAQAKYHFAGLWSNACCTHPMPGELPAAAARRRVREELGVSIGLLRHCGTFAYRAGDPASGLVEHEFDHVLAGTCIGRPEPDPAEIDAVEWHDVDPAQLGWSRGPSFTPWFAQVLLLACADPDM